MSELKPCPFCGGEAHVIHMDLGAIADGWKTWGVACTRDWEADSHGEFHHGHFIENYATEQEAIDAWNTRHVDGSTSDGYHTFDELYYHRTALFACLVASQPRQMAFKSWRHSDGTMYDGMFIAGIYTSRGWCTYHCDAVWWPLFDCMEREFAPEWDGHTPSDAIHRLMHDMLPKQDVSGEMEQ